MLDSYLGVKVLMGLYSQLSSKYFSSKSKGFVQRIGYSPGCVVYMHIYIGDQKRTYCDDA
jgi:hypothetical protein